MNHDQNFFCFENLGSDGHDQTLNGQLHELSLNL